MRQLVRSSPQPYPGGTAGLSCSLTLTYVPAVGLQAAEPGGQSWPRAGPFPVGGAWASPGLGVPEGDSEEMVSSLTSCARPPAWAAWGRPSAVRVPPLLLPPAAHSTPLSPLPTATAGGGGREAARAREARVAAAHRVQAPQPGADHLRREPGTCVLEPAVCSPGAGCRGRRDGAGSSPGRSATACL